MPKFAKKSLSFLLRNDCHRQFRLSLYSDTERSSLPIPPRQDQRPGAGQVGEAGDKWQEEQLANVQTIFGSASIVAAPPKPGKVRPEPLLLDLPATAGAYNFDLKNLKPFQFLVEGRFDLPRNFRNNFKINGLKDEWGLPLTFSALQPDIILALPSRASEPNLFAPEPFPHEILLDGDTRPIHPTDTRTLLRVIDIKMAEEPGAHYFAEVVYYAMALAGWLAENGLDKEFVVSANPAVWPGSYVKSALAELHERSLRGVAASQRDLIGAMNEDIESAETGVYVPALRRFFFERLPFLLSTPWNDLEWFVCFRCQNCEFLGYPWDATKTHNEHCWIKAEREDSLCRIAGISRGATKTLDRAGQKTVADVGALPPGAPVFELHPTLRARGEIFRERALSLGSRVASAVVGSGASATIPTYCDLKICVFLDYDAATSITATLAMTADWREPVFDVPPGAAREHNRWKPPVFTVGAANVPEEEKQVLAFLRELKKVMKEVKAFDEARSKRNHAHDLLSNPAATEPTLISSYQVFLWDEAQFRHLKRLIARHFQAIVKDSDLRSLAWLFPPEDVVPHPDLATRQSPISLLGPAVDHHVAAPIPHHYTLLRVAQTYLTPTATTPLRVHPLFSEPLTNLVPGERIHQFWNHKVTKAFPSWASIGPVLEETARKKALALSFILARLQRDARAGRITLGASAAPYLGDLRTPTFKFPTEESQLWWEFARLNAKMQEVEAELVYALPPVEREAKFASAWLKKRLDDPVDAQNAFDKIAATYHVAFSPHLRRVVYTVAKSSREAKFKDGDFTLALSPRDEDLFLHRTAKTHLKLFNAAHKAATGKDLMKGRNTAIGKCNLTAVTMEFFDRQNGFAVLLLDDDNCIFDIEAAGDTDFSRDVMLDKIGEEFLSKKVRLSLEGLGVPVSYSTNVIPLGNRLSPDRVLAVPHAVALVSKKGKALGEDRPGHDFLYWPHLTITQSVSRPVASLRAQVLAHGLNLNPSQERAFDAALSQRLSLIWGPPGTGKSATLKAILLGAVENARATKKALRILVTAGTYTAVDNVLLGSEEILRSLGLSLPAKSTPVPGMTRLFRIQSDSAPVDSATAHKHSHLTCIALKKSAPSLEAVCLIRDLGEPEAGDIILVGAPNQQVHNLAVAGTKESYTDTRKEWFDILIIDEASQMDTASSALVFTKVAEGGSAILAGDHLQLPPIHAADVPKGLESLVGPVFSFFVEHHHLARFALDDNYRSNQIIVDFVRQAGYDDTLQAHFSDLLLNLTTAIPTKKPADWPAHLPFSPHYATILDPQTPLFCFVAEDAISGQSNPFEAQTIAALSWLLWRRLAPAWSGLYPSDRPQSASPYDADKFWKNGIGIVAPHRAQCSLITDKLGQAFLGKKPSTGATPQGIRAAVDTVERYQGQERDAIFASFGLGDPDLIALEDEFLYDLNRFNVLVSRAATKAFVMLSRPVVEHLADDQDVLRASRLLKNFVGLTCGHAAIIELPYFDASGTLQTQKGELRWA